MRSEEFHTLPTGAQVDRVVRAFLERCAGVKVRGADGRTVPAYFRVRNFLLQQEGVNMAVLWEYLENLEGEAPGSVAELIRRAKARQVAAKARREAALYARHRLSAYPEFDRRLLRVRG